MITRPRLARGRARKTFVYPPALPVAALEALIALAIHSAARKDNAVAVHLLRLIREDAGLPARMP